MSNKENRLKRRNFEEKATHTAGFDPKQQPASSNVRADRLGRKYAEERQSVAARPRTAVEK